MKKVHMIREGHTFTIISSVYKLKQSILLVEPFIKWHRVTFFRWWSYSKLLTKYTSPSNLNILYVMCPMNNTLRIGQFFCSWHMTYYAFKTLTAFLNVLLEFELLCKHSDKFTFYTDKRKRGTFLPIVMKLNVIVKISMGPSDNTTFL